MRHLRRGFTLIELLVVSTVIGLLVAILLPVFASARERSRTTTCQSNLRQIAVAFQLYLQDDGGVYPLDIGSNRGTDEWTQEIAPYLKNDQVLRCPDLPPDATLDAAPNYPLATGYAFNLPWLNVFLPPYPTKNIQGASEASLATPATIWLNRDGEWSDANGDHYFRTVPQTSCGRSFAGNTLHSGGGNYSFVDGHVRWLTPEQAGETNCANGPPPAPFRN